jgi:hypothetical protein
VRPTYGVRVWQKRGYGDSSKCEALSAPCWGRGGVRDAFGRMPAGADAGMGRAPSTDYPPKRMSAAGVTMRAAASRRQNCWL